MDKKQFKFVMPAEVKRWIAIESAKNLRSQTATVNLILREKMEQDSQIAENA